MSYQSSDPKGGAREESSRSVELNSTLDVMAFILKYLGKTLAEATREVMHDIPIEAIRTRG